jgi:hypothetical protein
VYINTHGCESPVNFIADMFHHQQVAYTIPRIAPHEAAINNVAGDVYRQLSSEIYLNNTRCLGKLIHLEEAPNL